MKCLEQYMVHNTHLKEALCEYSALPSMGTLRGRSVREVRVLCGGNTGQRVTPIRLELESSHIWTIVSGIFQWGALVTQQFHFWEFILRK